MKPLLHAVFRSYAEVFFLQGGVVGFLLFGITMLNPRLGLAGFVAVLSAYGFARLLGMGKVFLESGFYTCNPLLVGLSVGHLFQLNALGLFFCVAAGVLTLLVTVALANVFATYLRLPLLSLPFVVVSSLVYMASLRYGNLLAATAHQPAWLTDDFGLPLPLAGFLKSFGALLFTPSVVVGAGTAALILFRSRILFLLAALGYVVGTTVRDWMLGSAVKAHGDPLNFNFLLIAMAVGGVFLIPSRRSYLLAAITVAVSPIVMDAIAGFWSYYGIPAFTLPFATVTLAVVYVLGLVGSPLIPQRIGLTPEETLDQHLANRLRYPGSERTLLPPFAGAWTVWQGFDGPWTHQGAWRYAYDFVLTDADGKTHANAGAQLEDYYCFNKPVLSPVRGRVVAAVGDFPDSPINDPDKVNNWGNLVVIAEPRGWHVELSHFAAESLRVKVGDWVERGTVLGLCGNSGYSPQPHIHVQAQLAETPGAATVPFSFVSYAEDGIFHANDLPKVGSKVEALYANKRLDSVTNFVLDEEYRYAVTRRGQPQADLLLKVRMALDGTFYFDSGAGQLYFGRFEGTYYAYRCDGTDARLRALFLALPRLPLACRDGLAWHDHAPTALVARGLRGALVGVGSSVWHRLARVRVHSRYVGESRVETEVRSRALGVKLTAAVTFDRNKAFATVTCGDWELKRRDDAK
jgi:urea transporter/murein DD-endopeptidase MepM/ murein hydrolase activator NlpD